MTELKTRQTSASVRALLDGIEVKKRVQKLGKFKTGKSCLYIKSLADIDQTELEGLIGDFAKYMNTEYAV